MSAVTTPTKLKPPTLPPQAAVAQTSDRPKRMSLDAVVRGKIAKPPRVLLYGFEGIGKSTFAASAPNPIFIGAEDGTSELDVARFPQPESWEDMLEAIHELTTSPHDYKTVVIDTLDWLEPFCWERTCRGKKHEKSGKPITHIEEFGFGKGYIAALDHWRVLTARLETLRGQRRMAVVLLAHAYIKTFKNPTGEDYDRFQMKVQDKAAGHLREWCDASLFAMYETHTYESNGRTKGISTGARVVHTQRTAAWDAKNRYDLPEKLPLDWDAFAEAVAAHRPAEPATLRRRIDVLLEQTSDDGLIERVQKAVSAAGDDAATLAKIENKLAAMMSVQEDNQTQETAE